MVPVSDPVVQSFIAHSSILALKVLGMALLTAKQRFSKKVVSNPEDLALASSGGGKIKFDDPDVERVRRAHLNDLENIPAFWILGGLYLTTSPATSTAVWLFRIFTASRFLHTYVYAINPIRQPVRAIVFEVANIVNIYMGVRVIMHYYSAL